MGAKRDRVEERRRRAVFLEALPVRGKERRLARELERSALYSSRLCVASSVKPTALTRLTATRPAKVFPRQVSTGKSVQSASLVSRDGGFNRVLYRRRRSNLRRGKMRRAKYLRRAEYHVSRVMRPTSPRKLPSCHHQRKPAPRRRLLSNCVRSPAAPRQPSPLSWSLNPTRPAGAPKSVEVDAKLKLPWAEATRWESEGSSESQSP
jgi:hypothetical protein